MIGAKCKKNKASLKIKVMQMTWSGRICSQLEGMHPGQRGQSSYRAIAQHCHPLPLFPRKNCQFYVNFVGNVYKPILCESAKTCPQVGFLYSLPGVSLLFRIQSEHSGKKGQLARYGNLVQNSCIAEDNILYHSVSNWAWVTRASQDAWGMLAKWSQVRIVNTESRLLA